MDNNVEKLVIAWLSSTLDSSWPVYGDKPQSLPDSFILVDRTGGPRESMVLDQAEILIEVYHKTSRMNASDEASLIANAIPDLLAYTDNITHAKVNSVVNLADNIISYQRYQIYCDIFVRQ